MSDTVEPLVLAGPLAAAIVEASVELKDVTRSRVADTGTYRYRFADLADALPDVRPVLHDHGLAHMQPVGTTLVGNTVHVAVQTMIVHTSGATYTSPALVLVVPSTDPQKVGSAITYGRRYSLMATLGITGDDDDDAVDLRTAPGPSRRATPTTPTTPPPTYRTPAEARARELLNAAPAETRTAIQRAFKEHFGTNLSSLPRDQHAEALSFVIEQLAVPDDPEAPGDLAES